MAGTDAPAGDKLKVFVSYSRADIGFADQLVLALEDKGFDPILDRHDIDAAEKWRERLGGLIFSCDTVVFVLTETSAGSPICAWEVEEAVRLGKRTIPVVPRPVEGVKPPPALGDLNWIHFFETPAIPGSGFYDGVKRLDRALRVDLGWLREQTRLSEQAAQWARTRADDLLLRGVALDDALAWRGRKPAGAEVQPLVRDYLAASEIAAETRKAEAAAQIAEREGALKEKEEAVAQRAQADRIARRATLIGTAVAGALLVVAGLGNWFAADMAVRNAERRAGQFAQESLSLAEPTERPLAISFALAGDPAARRGLLERIFRPEGHRSARDALASAVAHNRLERILPVGAAIDALAISRDGRLVATGSRDGKVRVWSLAGRDPPATFGADHDVDFLVFSPDGQKVASASGLTIRVWTAGGERLATVEGYSAAAFSPDGGSLVAWSNYNDGGGAAVYSVADGRLLTTLQETAVSSAAYSRDGATILTASDDGKVRTWAATGGRLLRTLDAEHTNAGGAWNSVLLFPDGDRVLVREVETTRIVPVSGEAEPVPLALGEGVRAVALSPDGTKVLAAYEGGAASVWSALDGARLTTLDFGGRAESGHDRDSRVVRRLERGIDGGVVRSVAVAPDGAHVITGSGDGNARLFSSSGASPSVTIRSGRFAKALAVSPDGSRLAVGSFDGVVRIWSVRDNALVAAMERPGGAVGDLDQSRRIHSVAFSPDGQRVAAGYLNGPAVVWPTGGGAAFATLETERGVNAIAFSRDGKSLVTGSRDGVRLWEASGGAPKISFKDIAITWSVAFSPDGARVAAGSMDGKARIWRVTGGEPLVFDHGEASALVASVQFSPDGERLLTVTSDGAVSIWSTRDGKQLTTIDVGNRVNGATFSADATRVIAGSADSYVRMWSATTAVAIAEFRLNRPTSEGINAVAVTPDDKNVVATYGSMVGVWPVPRVVLAPAAEQVRIACATLRSIGYTRFTDADLQRFPILQNEAREPCAGVR